VEEVSDYEKTFCLFVSRRNSSVTLWGQLTVQQQLLQAISLQKEGHYDKVIATLPAIIGWDSLTPLEKRTDLDHPWFRL